MSSFTHISTSLESLKQELAKQIFGITLAEAHSASICIDCKESILDLGWYDWTVLDCKEWRQSGLCPTCWNKITDF